MIDPALAYIGIGSNLGDRCAIIKSAIARLQSSDSVVLVAQSSVMETLPVGPPGQAAYLNAAVAIRTGLPPRDLLDLLLKIEKAHGRQRCEGKRWGPRTLDLDLLLYGDESIDKPGLIVPHPRMHERSFVLRPLAEIAPEVVHPVIGQTIVTLASRLPAPATME